LKSSSSIHRKQDGKISMRNARSYWSSHLAAIKTQGDSTSAYARRHQLSLACLYYWRSKLQSGLAPPSVPVPVLAIGPKPQSKFVALRVSDAASDAAVDVDVAVDVTPPRRCTLVLTAGVRLEMSALPDPQWLAALGRAQQGLH
jgi:transposase-like protein